MSEQPHLRIRNWKKHQHYSFRKPPWIKLYREILDDVEWHKLSGESAKGLVMLWLIASEDDGRLPDSAALAFRLRISENRVNALLSDCSHWIEGHASKMLAECKQYAIPEKETELEIEREKETENPQPERLASWIPLSLWADYRQMREKMRCPLTPGAIDILIGELGKLRDAGEDVAEVMRQAIAGGWYTFKAVRKEKENGAKESFEEQRQRKSREAIGAVRERADEVLREVGATPRLESGEQKANRGVRRSLN